ncbi:MAG: phosphoribosylglycinamide formyltransferase [Candidatus Nitrosopolaris sp.]
MSTIKYTHLINLAILISGRGSNMEAILSAIKLQKIKNVRPSIVISDKPDADGLKIASEKFGVTTKTLVGHGSKGWEYDQKLLPVLEEYGVNKKEGVICLAGFIRVLSREFVDAYKMRIMNIHPALLPSFQGLRAQKQALDYGVKVSGCTVHFVDEGIDTGPIILQKTVPVFASDTEELLAERILKVEHELYPEALGLFSKGNIRIEGRRVSINGTRKKLTNF